MKKQKLGLNKLNLSKSRIAKLSSSQILGGNEITDQHCYLSGPIDIIVCPITATCNTAICTDNCGTNNCGTNQCNQTQEVISCIEIC